MTCLVFCWLVQGTVARMKSWLKEIKAKITVLELPGLDPSSFGLPVTRKPEVIPSQKARWNILACWVLVSPLTSNLGTSLRSCAKFCGEM